MDYSGISSYCSYTCILRPSGSPQGKITHQRNPLSPRNGPALMCLLSSALSHWLGVVHGKYDLKANGVMYQSTASGPSVHHTSYSQRSEKHILTATTEPIITGPTKTYVLLEEAQAHLSFAPFSHPRAGLTLLYSSSTLFIWNILGVC